MRKLYYSFTESNGLSVIVEKKNGKGLLHSYGEHHETKLDSLLSDEGFECQHPDGYLEIKELYQQYRTSPTFESNESMLKALFIVSEFYGVSERVKMEYGDFYDPNFLYNQ